MFDVSETVVRRTLFRGAVVAAVVLPAALLGGCAQQTAAQPAPVVQPAAPPPPAPAPAPVPTPPVRG